MSLTRGEGGGQELQSLMPITTGLFQNSQQFKDGKVPSGLFELGDIQRVGVFDSHILHLQQSNVTHRWEKGDTETNTLKQSHSPDE